MSRKIGFQGSRYYYGKFGLEKGDNKVRISMVFGAALGKGLRAKHVFHKLKYWFVY
jgi:hypothetical protein